MEKVRRYRRNLAWILVLATVFGMIQYPAHNTPVSVKAADSQTEKKVTLSEDGVLKVEGVYSVSAEMLDGIEKQEILKIEFDENVYFIKEDYELKFGIEDIIGITKELATNVIKKTTPVFLNDTFWAFGSVLYSVAYATAGTSAMAASQIASTTGNFFIMTAVCIAIGSSIMMGNELGANNIDTAVRYSKKFSVLVTIAGLIFGILLIIVKK